MVRSRFAVRAEPNHGEIERVTTGGAISRLVDVSASRGTSFRPRIAHHGVFYLGNLGTFGPEDQAGDQHVYQVTPNGHLQDRVDGSREGDSASHSSVARSTRSR